MGDPLRGRMAALVCFLTGRPAATDAEIDAAIGALGLAQEWSVPDDRGPARVTTKS